MPAWLEWSSTVAPFISMVLIIVLVILYSQTLRRVRAKERRLTEWHTAANTSLASLRKSQRGLDEVLLALYDDPTVRARMDARRAEDAAIIEASLAEAGHGDISVTPIAHDEPPEPRTPGDDRA